MTQPKILVVEAEHSSDLATALFDAGFEPLMTSSLEAPLVARREGPQAVILDVDLPDGAGLEVLRLLRHEPRLAGVPFLLASDEVDPHLTLRAHQEGASDYLQKPVEPRRLVRRLRDLLQASTVEAP